MSGGMKTVPCGKSIRRLYLRLEPEIFQILRRIVPPES